MGCDEVMPNPGFKCVTIKKDVSDRWHEHLKKRGIPEKFHSAFLLLEFSKQQEESRKLRNLATKITKIPDKFLELKIKEQES